jgi:hypothetical protein
VANLSSVVLDQFSFLAVPMFGFFQWLVLRNYIRHLGRWVLVSAFGWITSFLIIYILNIGDKIFEIAPKTEMVIVGVSINIQLLWSYVLTMLLWSSIVGIFQWLVLRNHIHFANWWIFASCIGGVMRGFAIAVLIAIIDPIVVNVVSLLIYGGLTGFALVWLLQTQIKRRLKQQMYWS